MHVRIHMMMRGTQVSKKKWDRRGCARHMGSASSVCGVVGLRFRARQKKGAISYRNIDCITDGARHVAHASCTLSVRASCLHVCGNRGPRTTCCSCIHVSVNDNDTKCPLLKLLARSMLNAQMSSRYVPMYFTIDRNASQLACFKLSLLLLL